MIVHCYLVKAPQDARERHPALPEGSMAPPPPPVPAQRTGRYRQRHHHGGSHRAHSAGRWGRPSTIHPRRGGGRSQEIKVLNLYSLL